MHFAVIDIETTGGKATTDRITEIGIVKHDGEKEIARWHSLINPERAIPPFITGLTGIDDQMVSKAPKFYEIAKSLVEFTEDCFFVAHNIGFDYSFIQHEFKSLGFNYNRKRFCTVQLSRKLLPGHKSYSLGKLCASLNIPLANHHRALDDALATSKILELLFQKEGFQEYLDSPREKLLAQKNFSRELLKKLDSFPDAIGVYYFLNSKQEIIYVGKSIHIKKRIFTHLYRAKTSKANAMKEEVTDFDFVETGSEMIALLKENEEIKKIQPKYNRALKKKHFNHGLIVLENQNGAKNLKVVPVKQGLSPVMVFTSKKAAMNTVESLERKFKLCSRENSMTTRSSICLQCMGKCFVDQKDVSEYNERVEEAVSSIGLSGKSLLVIEENESGTHVAVVKDGVYCGFKTIDDSSQIASLENFSESFYQVQDKDALNIIRHFVFSENKNVKVIEI